MLCVATFLIGSHNAFVQQYRFAVAESASPDRLGRSLSILMLAGVAAAYIGPKMATELNLRLQRTSMRVVWGECADDMYWECNHVRPDHPKSAQKEGSGRSLVIANSLTFSLYGCRGVLEHYESAQTATPVAMHEVDGFNMQDTAFVIQSHIMAMFLPSLVTGVLMIDMVRR